MCPDTNTHMRALVPAFLVLLVGTTSWSADPTPPVKLAIVGLVHDHANGFLPRALASAEVRIVGIVEPDKPLAEHYARQFKLSSGQFFSSLDELLARTNVQAVAAFTSTFDHRRVVEACAPRRIDVMMEKPLAVNMEHARAIAAAAKESGIRIVVNYETTWYPANQRAFGIVADHRNIGELRKVVVHDGHRGPKEIGCSATFLQWLTDPVLNGGGALTDFGCYGADLITHLMGGQRPTSVFAVTQQLKPDVYPKVDDEATIVVTYPHAQGIIQASWNWPIDRKDMEIYGRVGQVIIPRRDVLRVRKPGADETEDKLAGPVEPVYMSNEIAYFAAVVRGEIQPSGLS